jgi:hypothetical protein
LPQAWLPAAGYYEQYNSDESDEERAKANHLRRKTLRIAERCERVHALEREAELEEGSMKIFLDLSTPDSPVRRVIEQIFTDLGKLEFVKTQDEADGIIADEPIKVWDYYNRTTKRVAQVLWWKQEAAKIPPSDRFKVFDVLPTANRGSLPGLIEAIAFLKGK